MKVVVCAVILFVLLGFSVNPSDQAFGNVSGDRVTRSGPLMTESTPMEANLPATEKDLLNQLQQNLGENDKTKPEKKDKKQTTNNKNPDRKDYLAF